MERKDRKALAAAVAMVLVLGTSNGASALTIGNLEASLQGWFESTVPSEVTRQEISVSFATLKELVVQREATRRAAMTELLVSYRSNLVDRVDQDGGGAATPEPSAALVFGLGLLVASRFHRRKR